MALPIALIDELFGITEDSTTVKRGEDIFGGTDYPHDWAGFIGQVDAKEQLQTAITSAQARGKRLDHTLLQSGIPGVGKTTLATLTAYKAGVGFLQTTGPLTLAQFRRQVLSMQDHDILFIDEIHRLTSGSKNQVDWMLPFLTEGVLYTDRGAEPMPDVTVMGATTEAGKLPQTFLDRFMCQPTITGYTPAEGAQIAHGLSGRMDVPVDPGTCVSIAMAADQNPRIMRKIFTQVRDLSHTRPESHPNLPKAFEWAGVSEDGLAVTAREILVLLLAARDNTSSIDSIRAQLNEPGPIRHHEQALLQRGLVTITGRGRQLTDAGRSRALREVHALRSRL